MRVKICGLTNKDDALFAAEAGADALGFVFYKPSPRYIDPVEVKKIVAALPVFVESVGLFVDTTKEQIEEVVRYCKLSRAQLHFDTTDSFVDSIGVPVLPVVRAKAKEDIEKFKEKFCLVDAFVQSYGGSGKRLALEWFKQRDNSRIVLAGGLTPDNLHELKGFGFAGVDVSSGVEKHAGIKDHNKVKDFITYAKAL